MLDRAGGSPLDLIRIAWPDAPNDALDLYRIALAIDAPLGFPLAFQRLVSGATIPSVDFGPEIQNPFAYRETERWIYHHYGKKPLSAPFDKLGNNATAAIYHARRWAQASGFVIVPFQADRGDRHVIVEVYPALVKRAGTRECLPALAPLLPDDLSPGSDEYDATLCAVLASCYAAPIARTAGRVLELAGPPASIDPEVCAVEGWIYAFPSYLVGENDK